MPSKKELERMGAREAAQEILKLTRPELALDLNTCPACDAPLKITRLPPTPVQGDYVAMVNERNKVEHYAHQVRGIACNARAGWRKAVAQKFVQVQYSKAWHRVFSAAAAIDSSLEPVVYLDVFEQVERDHYGVDLRGKIDTGPTYAMWVKPSCLDVMQVVEPTTEAGHTNERAVAMLLNLDLPELRTAIDAKIVENAFGKEE